MKLRAGQKLASTVCATRLVVVKAPDADLDLRCGGAPMVALDDGEPVISGSPAAGHDAGTLLGKRYADEDAGLELLCMQAGAGSLSVGDVEVAVKGAKPLPSSD